MAGAEVRHAIMWVVNPQQADSELLMKCPIRYGVCLLSMAFTSVIAWADYSCSGVLTSSQQEGFKALFSPSYSPSLNIGDPNQSSTWKKILSHDDLTRLKVDMPGVAMTETLSGQQAGDLKGWLNDDASTTIPGWFSTVVTVTEIGRAHV